LASVKISVRPLRGGDYKPIREIERAGADEYARYLKETGETDTVAPSINPAYFRHYLKMGGSFIAEANGRIVGYVLSQPTSFVHSNKKELWLEYIIVSPEHRRKRIGSRLLAEVAKWARRHNVRLLYTNLNPNNPESQALLEKHGFEVRSWMIAERVLK
jgi:ribosomal protein S18 acetylase RimI-like enzyme